MCKRAMLCLLLGAGSTACGSAEGEPSSDTREDEASSDTREDEASLLSQSEGLSISFGQPALPENTSNVQELESVAFHFCSFTIGTAEQAPPFPPQRLVWLRRQPVAGRFCPAGYVVLGSSFGFPVVDLQRHPFLPALVASFTTKLTPSGSAHTQLRMVQPSYATGALLHQSALAAMAPSASQPFLGNVLSGELSLELNGTLHVTGEKDGLISPGEPPPGAPNYSAVYDFFLFDPNPSPVADEISTF